MKKENTEGFIIKANKIHKDLFDYSQVIYEGSFSKVKILCKNCNQYFLQRPSDHLTGIGCPNCKHIKSANTSNKTFSNKFFKKAVEVHGEEYDYSKVNYAGANTKITILCKSCNKFFMQTPSIHLGGGGCPSCNRYHYDTNTFIEKARKIHGNKYDYSKVIYINSHSFVTIICNTCGKEFQQKAYSHLQGIGCKAHSAGFNRSSWIEFCNRKTSYDPKVYIIRCFNINENFIKIGITTTSIHNRFRKNKVQLPYSYEVLKEIKGSPDFVWDKEKELHKLCRPFQYTPSIYFQGETECFTLECLNTLHL